MSEFSLDITLSRTSFPELGLPGYPNDIDNANALLGQKAIKNDKKSGRMIEDSYKGYMRTSSKVLDTVYNFAMSKSQIFNRDSFSMSFDYNKGVPSTYKFLGMDIDSDLNAVIIVGDGYVVVDNLFSREEIKKACTYKVKVNVGEEVFNAINATVDSLSESVVRKLITSIKTGKFYEALRKAKERKSVSVEVHDFDDLINLICEEVFRGEQLSEARIPYKSVLMNLVSANIRKEALDSRNDASEESFETTAASILIGKCIEYWEGILSKYKNTLDTLSLVDMWQSQYKKILGEKEFNSRVLKSINLVNNSDASISQGTVAISGLVKNENIDDGDIIIGKSKSSLSSLKSLFVGDRYTRYVDIGYIESILLGNIDADKLDNPFTLSDNELQALSNYDSLQYSSDDIKVCMESYDMSNEDERALFLDSVVKSYEKNFKEYKPKNNYEVTEALAGLIENRESIRSKIIPESEYDSEANDSVHVVSDTGENIRVKVDRQRLYKVAKLSNKTLSNVLKMFA